MLSRKDLELINRVLDYLKRKNIGIAEEDINDFEKMVAKYNRAHADSLRGHNRA